MDASVRQAKSRSRDGCWTCRTRRKKCPGGTFPCGSCVRLGLVCDFSTRLMWETDARRPGIKSRGPKKGAKRKLTRPKTSSAPLIDTEPVSTPEGEDNLGPDTSRSPPTATRSLSPHAFLRHVGWRQTFSDFPGLESTDYFLLDHYIHRFSRSYPAFPGPGNPFLAVFAVIAGKSKLVLHSLLALGGIQCLNNSSSQITTATLRTRQRALSCCRELLTQNSGIAQHTPLANMSTDDLLYLLASCMLLLLYEKLTGEGQANWEPHFQFISEVITCYLSRPEDDSSGWTSAAFDFLHNLFAYHDLLRAIQLRQPPISTYYEHTGQDPKFSYPRLIARICAADATVTEVDIYSWDGNMEWLPSFCPDSLDTYYGYQPPTSSSPGFVLQSFAVEEASQIDDRGFDSLATLSELYRISALLLRTQIWQSQFVCHNNISDAACQAHQRGQLAAQGMCLIGSLLQGSRFKSTLLWPISIIMQDLMAEQVMERQSLLAYLDLLSGYFQLRHFTALRDSLTLAWSGTAPDTNSRDQSWSFKTYIMAEPMLLG